MDRKENERIVEKLLNFCNGLRKIGRKISYRKEIRMKWRNKKRFSVSFRKLFRSKQKFLTYKEKIYLEYKI